MEEQVKKQTKSKTDTTIKNLEDKIKQLEEQLSAEKEEKKYLAEALQGKSTSVIETENDYKKQIAILEKDHEAKLNAVISSYENKIASEGNDINKMKEQFDKEYSRQIKYINRRENELNKLLNINENIIRSIESNAFLARTIQEYIYKDIMTTQKEEVSE